MKNRLALNSQKPTCLPLIPCTSKIFVSTLWKGFLTDPRHSRICLLSAAAVACVCAPCTPCTVLLMLLLL